jgi:uncharacterized protein YqjF (DUF2071 family)
MNKNDYTTKGARVIFNGRPGVVMKALEYKTVINFDDAERWVHLRHNQNDMSLLKSFEDVSKKSSKEEAIRKSVKVLNAPMGTVQQKQDYITYKLVGEGYEINEAMNIFLEALNIASNGELLKNI